MYISLLFVALLSVLLIGTDGESSSIAAGQVYWNNVLPKTSMPKAIQDLLIQPPAATKVLPNFNNKWNINNKASTVKVLPNKWQFWNKASTVKVLPNKWQFWSKASTLKVLPTVKVLPNKWQFWNKASTVKVLPNKWQFWSKASTEKVLPNSSIKNKKIAGDEKWSYDPTMTMFFLEEDLQAGTKMTLSFPDPSTYGTTFISKGQANSIPFASSYLPNILSFFSIDPNSPVASAMKENLAACEEKPMEGEIKQCATSLESMVDFAISALKTRNLLSVSTTTDKENTPKQEYEVTSSNIKSSGDNTVVCHAQTYAYAVFYCHKLRDVDVFDVEMVGDDGSKVEALATCHRDTSKWNPKNLGLRILNVKPGTVPVCHFLLQYDVLWMPKK